MNAGLAVERLTRGERGISGLETAIVLIAFVVISSVFAFAVLSTGLFSTDKAKSTIMSSLDEARGTLEVRGVRATVTMTTRISQSIGTGDASTTTFSTLNAPVIPGTETVKIDGAAQTIGSAYSMHYDSGLVTFTAAPASSTAITADYTYYVIDKIRVTLSNAAAGNAVDLTGDKTVVTYLDPNSISTNIVNFTITALGSADSDNLLEPGEVFELSVDVSAYGLTTYDDFTLQIKPASGAVLVLGRRIPSYVAAEMDLG